MKHLFCLALFFLSLRTIRGDESTFKVVAVEARVDSSKTALENLIRYVKSIKDHVGATDVDMIVLPEYALTGIRFDKANDFTIEIEKDNTIIPELKKLSSDLKDCYVIANVIEKVDDNFYSTTVVVKNSEKEIKKYRKINIHEKETKLSSGEDILKFEDAKIGTIAIISGEDILYENPSQKIFETNDDDKSEPTTVIYTAGLRSLAPFQAALSVAQGYAKANGVNLIMSNYDDTKNGLGGSGIFTPSEVLSKQISDSPGTAIMVVDVPILKQRTASKCSENKKLTTNYNTNSTLKSFGVTSAFNFTLDKDLTDNLETEVLNGDVKNYEKCDGSFCCTFNVNATWNINTERYKLAVKGGDVKICTIMACDKWGNDNTCGILESVTTSKIKTTFSKIEITSSDASDESFRPYTVLSGFDVIINADFCQSDEKVEMKFNSQKEVEQVVVFGIRTISGADSLSLLLGTKLIALMLTLKYLF